eukprot:5438592-Amphidinium_carterae.1
MRTLSLKAFFEPALPGDGKGMRAGVSVMCRPWIGAHVIPCTHVLLKGRVQANSLWGAITEWRGHDLLLWHARSAPA